MRRAPLRGAAPHEGLPFGTAREVPRLVRGRAGAQVQREAQERELPAHPNGPWPIGRPMVVVADDVPEPELGAILDGARSTVTRLTSPPNSHVTASRRGGRHSVISPPALPSSWKRPPRRRSPATGRNQRGIRSGFVHTSQTSATGAS